MSEKRVWSSAPSQMINAGQFILYGALTCFLIITPSELPFYLILIPIVLAFWQFLSVQNTIYELTNERLITHEGIFTKTIDELELYRVRDFRIQQPFHLRVVGLANIVLVTADITSPILILRAVPNARELLNEIRTLVEARRDAKGVRAVDVGYPIH